MDAYFHLRSLLELWGVIHRDAFEPVSRDFTTLQWQHLVDFVSAIIFDGFPCSVPQSAQGAMLSFAEPLRPDYEYNCMHMQYAYDCLQCSDITSCGLSSTGHWAVYARYMHPDDQYFDDYAQLSVALMSATLLGMEPAVYLPEGYRASGRCELVLDRFTVCTYSMEKIRSVCLGSLPDFSPMPAPAPAPTPARAPAQDTTEETWERKYEQARDFVERVGKLPNDWNHPVSVWLQEQRYCYRTDQPNPPLKDDQIRRLEMLDPDWLLHSFSSAGYWGRQIYSLLHFVKMRRRLPNLNETHQGYQVGSDLNHLRERFHRRLEPELSKGKCCLLDNYIPGWYL